MEYHQKMSWSDHLSHDDGLNTTGPITRLGCRFSHVVPTARLSRLRDCAQDAKIAKRFFSSNRNERFDKDFAFRALREIKYTLSVLRACGSIFCFNKTVYCNFAIFRLLVSLLLQRSGWRVAQSGTIYYISYPGRNSRRENRKPGVERIESKTRIWDWKA